MGKPALSNSKFGPIALIVVLAVIISAIIFARNSSSPPAIAGNPGQAGGGNQDSSDVQIVTLGLSGSSYTPNPIVVKAGKTVVLQKGDTLQGCAQQVIQPQLGINANFLNSNEYRFLPMQKGTFAFSCTMGMYRGVIVVE